jgi:hypothetical protein
MNRDVTTSEYQRFPFEAIPRRIFLDTNVVDCLVKWGDCIFEQQEPPSDIDETLRSDIDSLMNIFLVGSRAQWDIVISSKTLDELYETSDEWLRQRFMFYGADLAQYAASNGLTDDEHKYAREVGRKLADSSFLSALPHANDRELISHAIALGCDTFCTRDLRSMYRRKHKLSTIPVQILRPVEWWQHIRPWAALWV